MRLAIALAGGLVARSVALPAEVASKATAPTRESARVVHFIPQVSISPDGRFVAWSRIDRGINESSPSSEPKLYLTNLRARESELKQIGVGEANDRRDGHDPAWSPDGKRLAFLCDAPTKGQQQIYVVETNGGEPK